jgi:hypothetical protein
MRSAGSTAWGSPDRLAAAERDADLACPVAVPLCPRGDAACMVELRLGRPGERGMAGIGMGGGLSSKTVELQKPIFLRQMQVCTDRSPRYSASCSFRDDPFLQRQYHSLTDFHWGREDADFLCYSNSGNPDRKEFRLAEDSRPAALLARKQLADVGDLNGNCF